MGVMPVHSLDPSVLTTQSIRASVIIADLDLPETEKARLLAVTPRDYVGHASALVDCLTHKGR